MEFGVDRFVSPVQSSGSDDSLLLRLVNSYFWDEMIRRCELMAEVFSSSSRDQDLALHGQQVERCKRQLIYHDDWGNTPLHLACYNRAPTAAIQALLNAGALAFLQLTSLTTKDGSTPLLIACATGLDFGSIDSLLYPPGEGTRDVEADGAACMLRKADTLGSTPLSELCISYELQRKQRRHRRSSPSLSEIRRIDDIDSELFGTFLTKVEALVRAAWGASSPYAEAERENDLRGGRSWLSILPGIAFLAETCPPVLGDLFCRSYPHMISISDRNAVLPLHLAVSTVDRAVDQKERRAHFVNTLLDAYPAAARKTSNLRSRSPFCDAISSAMTLQMSDGTVGPVQRFCDLIPEAISTRDLKTGLHPFLLAATISTSSYRSEADHTGVIFGLMRLYPQLIHELTTVKRTTPQTAIDPPTKARLDLRRVI